MPNDPEYDVAISLLSRDVALGQGLHDELSKSLSVFFYPRNQEELAGTDGLETTRSPFVDDCRVVVILYRTDWGKTPWTRVEEQAIKDGCLKHGWQRLFVVALEKVEEMAKWIPHTHIKYDFDQFGMDQLIGAIKARVLENHGQIQPMTAVKRAEILKADDQYRDQRRTAVSPHGEAELKKSVLRLYQEIDQQCEAVRTDGNQHIQSGIHTSDLQCVITDGRSSMLLFWQGDRTPDQVGYLVAREFDCRLRLPNEPFNGPRVVTKPLNQISYKPELSRSLELGWTEEGAAASFISNHELASRCVIQFLELLDRKSSGKVPRQRKLTIL